MRLSNKQLAARFLNLTVKAPVPAEVLPRLAAYLISAKRTKDLGAIGREMALLREAQLGVVEINTISRWPLKAEVKRAAAKVFKAEKAVFNEKLDPAVLGGVRFESLDKRLDITLKSRLNKLTKPLKAT